MARRHKHEDAHGARELEGRYANYFKVGYNAFEFVIDFGQHYTEARGAQLHTRIVTGPGYAKELLHFLQDRIERYESDFGSINAGGDDDATRRSD